MQSSRREGIKSNSCNGSTSNGANVNLQRRLLDQSMTSSQNNQWRSVIPKRPNGRLRNVSSSSFCSDSSNHISVHSNSRKRFNGRSGSGYSSGHSVDTIYDISSGQGDIPEDVFSPTPVSNDLTSFEEKPDEVFGWCGHGCSNRCGHQEVASNLYGAENYGPDDLSSPKKRGNGSCSLDCGRREGQRASQEELHLGKSVMKESGLPSPLMGSNNFGVFSPPPASPMMLLPFYQYGPPMTPPWMTWPHLMPNNGCFIFPHSPSHLHPQPNSHCTYHQPSRSSSPSSEGSLSSGTKVPPFVNQSQYSPGSNHNSFSQDSGARSYTCKKSTPVRHHVESNLVCNEPPFTQSAGQFAPNQDSLSHLSFPNHVDPAMYNVPRKSSISFLTPFSIDPLRNSRLTQLPEDKCALLPMSPPFTPISSVFDPCGSSRDSSAYSFIHKGI